METIPLKPVFTNPQFKALNPDLKFFVLNAVYLLCGQGKAGEPIPDNLRYHFQCSESTYVKHIGVFRNILASVLPEIAKIKQHTHRQTKNACMTNIKNGAERRIERNRNTHLSDEKDTHTRFVAYPSHSQRFNPDQTDEVARQKAIENNAKAKKDGKQVYFTDA